MHNLPSQLKEIEENWLVVHWQLLKIYTLKGKYPSTLIDLLLYKLITTFPELVQNDILKCH